MSFDDSSQPASKALSYSKPMGRGCGCVLTGFFSLIIIMGIATLIPSFLFPLMEYLEATNWVETPCEIISSDVIEKNGMSRIAVEFSYRSHGEEFRSRKYRNYELTSTSHNSLLKIVENLRPGTKTVCYVNPDNISEAVLDRSFSPTILLGLFPLVLVLFGLFGLVFGRQYVQKIISNRVATIKNEEWRTITAIQEQGQTFQEEWEKNDWQPSPASSGPIELKSVSSTAFGLFFVVLFGVIWNGIVSVFLLEVADGWMKGNPDWFLTLFLIPFVLVGIGTILAFFYILLSLFNPKPRLFVSDATVALGESFKMNWKFKGSPSSIRRLQIQLVGTEWAQYRQGTNTHTDTNEFYCVDLFDTEQPMEMTEGELEVTLPKTTMHSFNASNNKIKWSLRVKGDIPMWPDVNQSFDFTVLPLPTG